MIKYMSKIYKDVILLGKKAPAGSGVNVGYTSHLKDKSAQIRH